MTGGDGEELPPRNEGEFLLRLVQRPRQNPPQPSSSLPPLQPQQNPPQPSSSLPPLQPHGVSLDPAVAAVGPTIPLPINGRHYPAPPAPSSDTSFSPNFLFHGLPHNHPSWPQQLSQSPPPPSLFNAAPLVQFNNIQEQLRHERSKLMLGNMPSSVVPQDGALSNSHPKFNFGFDPRGEFQVNGLHSSRGFNAPVSSGFRASTDDKVYKPPEIRHQPGPPPGFAGQPARPRARIEQNLLFKGPSTSTDLRFNQRAFGGDDSKGSWKSGESERSRETELNSALASETEGSLPNAHALVVDHLDHGVGHARQVNKLKMTDSWDCKGQDDEISELSEHFDESLGVVLVDEHDEKSDRKKHRDKDFRSDPRGQWTLSQKMRNSKRYIQCRSDVHRFNSSFLEIYESLKPAEEEKLKQKQLFSLLEKLVCKAWPNARLYLYGSCANSFGVSKSDIDVCLVIADQDINKSEVLLKLADILQSDNLENVQALTRARVPIVKLKDPVTGISCDICINNVLAVVNTKLLRDYAEIDVRLHQLAFIVKHWAKTRAVNETYQGTLSSYAYVLMCIHFLQQRRPAILPCLQGMDATYTVTVDDVKCSYFDQVERLQNFGARNRESIAQLVWGFFNYWAYCHDYANSVISVRTGSLLSKHEKDWTRRIGNERHLICIEDPFETSHDLGRVVDKHSIRVIREEFERAAFILQFDPNPFVELFRPYVSC